MTIKQTGLRKVMRTNKPSPPFNPNPDPNSNRSKKRKARGFKSLESSSRKHRRAHARLAGSQTIGNVRYPAGQVVELELSSYRSGGRLNYN